MSGLGREEALRGKFRGTDEPMQDLPRGVEGTIVSSLGQRIAVIQLD